MQAQAPFLAKQACVSASRHHGKGTYSIIVARTRFKNPICWRTEISYIVIDEQVLILRGIDAAKGRFHRDGTVLKLLEVSRSKSLRMR